MFYGSKTHLGARSSLVLVLVVRTHLHSKKASVPPIHGFVHPLTMAVIKQLLAKDAYMTSMCRLVWVAGPDFCYAYWILYHPHLMLSIFFYVIPRGRLLFTQTRKNGHFCEVFKQIGITFALNQNNLEPCHSINTPRYEIDKSSPRNEFLCRGEEDKMRKVGCCLKTPSRRRGPSSLVPMFGTMGM